MTQEGCNVTHRPLPECCALLVLRMKPGHRSNGFVGVRSIHPWLPFRKIQPGDRDESISLRLTRSRQAPLRAVQTVRFNSLRGQFVCQCDDFLWIIVVAIRQGLAETPPFERMGF